METTVAYIYIYIERERERERERQRERETDRQKEKINYYSRLNVHLPFCRKSYQKFSHICVRKKECWFSYLPDETMIYVLNSSSMPIKGV